MSGEMTPELLLDSLLAKSVVTGRPLLKEHIVDALDMAIKLIMFIDRNKLSCKFMVDVNLFSRCLIKSIILHDLGKISYEFQKRVMKKPMVNKKVLEEFLKETKGLSIRHEILSLIWSVILLGEDKYDCMIRTAVLLHHYNDYFAEDKSFIRIVYDPRGRNKEVLLKYIDFLIAKRNLIEGFLEKLVDYIRDEINKRGEYPGEIKCTINNVLTELRRGIQDGFKRLKCLKESIEEGVDVAKFCTMYEPPHRIEYTEETNEDFWFFLLLLGALRRCDYAASAHVDVEFLDITLQEFYDNILNIMDNIAKQEWGIQNGIKDSWQCKLLDRIETPKRLILVAPTGSGKTEFAILWALRHKEKLAYTLPLRVALNDLYDRFKDYANTPRCEDKIGLLHSTSFIEYLREKEEEKTVRIGEKVTVTRLLSNFINLSTPDQILLTSLNYYGSDKIISMYPFMCIVIDEIQTYTPEMAAIICKTLQLVKFMGGSFLVITATYPPYFKKFFDELCERTVDVAEYDGRIGDAEVKNYHIKRHRIKTIDHQLFEYTSEGIQLNDKAYNELKESIKEYISMRMLRILVITNNVSKAIELYRRLKEDKKEFSSIDKGSLIYLLHSRLLEKTKSDRVREIKQAIKENKPVILIATQVVEASVDIDFDCIITELSPIDSQIQRWGRVYRNRKEDYTNEKPNVIVFKSFDRGTCAIYDERVLSATWEILKKHENKLLGYKEEKQMIEDVFNMKVGGVMLKKLYEDEIEALLKDLRYFTVEKKSEAQRLFRQIAGEVIVFPEMMAQSSDEEERKLGEVLKSLISERQNITWQKICEKYEELYGEKLEDEYKWKAREIMYSYSTNVPVFLLRRLRNEKIVRSVVSWGCLKFALILRREVSEQERQEILKVLEEYGLDILLKMHEEMLLERLRAGL